MIMFVTIVLGMFLIHYVGKVSYRVGKSHGRELGHVQGVHEKASVEVALLAREMSDPVILALTLHAMSRAEDVRALEDHYFSLFSKKAEMLSDLDNNPEMGKHVVARNMVRDIETALKMLDVEKERRVSCLKGAKK